MTAPVVFIHGLLIHAVCWRHWQELFEKQGYRTHAPGWPGEGEAGVGTPGRPP